MSAACVSQVLLDAAPTCINAPDAEGDTPLCGSNGAFYFTPTQAGTGLACVNGCYGH